MPVELDANDHLGVVKDCRDPNSHLEKGEHVLWAHLAEALLWGSLDNAML